MKHTLSLSGTVDSFTPSQSDASKQLQHTKKNYIQKLSTH